MMNKIKFHHTINNNKKWMMKNNPNLPQIQENKEKAQIIII